MCVCVCVYCSTHCTKDNKVFAFLLKFISYNLTAHSKFYYIFFVSKAVYSDLLRLDILSLFIMNWCVCVCVVNMSVVRPVKHLRMVAKIVCPFGPFAFVVRFYCFYIFLYFHIKILRSIGTWFYFSVIVTFSMHHKDMRV